jgi:hypothetical protein
MPQQNELAEFLEALHDDVHAKVSLDESSSTEAHEAAFTELVAEELADYGAIDEIIPCLLDEKTSKGRVRTNGYFINEDADRLDLFVSMYRQAGDGDKITQTDIRRGFERARRVLHLIQQGRDLGDRTRSDQAVMIAAIRDAAASIREVRVFILTDCAAQDTNDINEPFEIWQSQCQIWDATRLLRRRNSGKAYEATQIKVRKYCAAGIPCLPMPDKKLGYRTYLALIPGNFLYQLYEEYGARLLELNVRSFLQVRGNVNKGIRDTIINHPTRFLAYNNGLTATVESLDTDTDKVGRLVITQLNGFQIVNGGQTVATIYHTAKKDKAPLDDIFVQAKITVVDEVTRDELVSHIARYANTQNRINEADFSSNDPFHVTIDELSQRIWAPGETSRWFYERARGQYQVLKSRIATTPAQRRKFDREVPTSQRFAKTDLAKYLNSWSQLPHIVSKGAQKNFIALMDSLGTNGERFIPDDAWYKRLVAQAIIYKKAESIARKLKLPSYRANAITYTVALVSYRTQQRINLDAIWETQSVSDSLSETIESWMPLVHRELAKSSGGRNVTEWCKKPECWKHIQMTKLSLPAELGNEVKQGQVLPNIEVPGRRLQQENAQHPSDRDGQHHQRQSAQRPLAQTKK